MKLDPVLISSRLAEARRLQSVDISVIAKQTGIDASLLLAIETGKKVPSGDQLLILANYYVRDFRDFVDPRRPNPFKQTDILYRRYGQEFTAADRRAIQEFLFMCEIEASLQKGLNKNLRIFSFQPEGEYRKLQGNQGARALRKHLGYHDKEVNMDIYSDFRNIGFHIFRRRLSNPSISGLYINHPIAGHCILVNYDEDIYRQRFSVSHEAAHAIFDSSEEINISYQRSSSRYNQQELKEIRANSFASSYLLPPTILKNIPVTSWDSSQAISWAQKLRVSTEALSYALLEEKLIDQNTAESIRSVRVAKSDKVDPETPSSLNKTQLEIRVQLLERGLSDDYVNLCFDAHQQGLISAGGLSEAFLTNYSEMQEISILYGRNINK